MKYNPPAGSQDPDAKYVTGQPGKVRGSAVPAEAVEHPQREIVEVIKKAGLTPSADALNQLYEAILKIIGVQVPVASKTETGLVQIGDGLNITPEGLLSVLVATSKQNGIMRPDGTTCTVEDGVLKVLQQPQPEVQQAQRRKRRALDRTTTTKHTTRTLSSTRRAERSRSRPPRPRRSHPSRTQTSS